MPNLATASSPETVDPALADIIAEVESSNNSRAFRFEPSVYENLATLNSEKIDLLDEIVRVNRCDFATAKVVYSTSYGLYQIMGFNIYSDPQWSADIFEFILGGQQTLVFARFLTRNEINIPWVTLKADHSALLHFAGVYNGPGDPEAYAAAMTKAASELGL